MKITNQMKIEIMSMPQNVALSRVAIAAFAAQLDFTLNDLDEIKVAVSEAVSNSIIHGYDKDPNRVVKIVVTLFSNNTLEITVEDEGKGIENLQEALQPAFSTDDDRMGLGFVFMQSFMDGLNVETSLNGGTKVTMVKKFDPNATVHDNKDS